MATSVVTYQPGAGRAFITLTSWAGDAAFTTTPVATNQIEGPDTLTLNADGTVTGADGTYTLRHIVASTGSTEGISYTIGAVAQVPQGAITIGTATIGETTASIPFTYDLSDQTGFEYRKGAEAWASTTSPVTLSNLTAETAYTVEIRSVNATGSGTAASTSITTLAAGTGPSSATTTVSFAAPTGKSVSTLITGFDPYIFQNWTSQPVVGEQIIATDSELTISELANVATDLEGVFDVWFVRLDGTTHALTIKTTELATVDGGAVDTTPDPFTVAPLTSQPLNQYVEFAPITVSSIDAGESIAVVVTGANVQYAVNAGAGYGGFTATSTNVQLGDLVKPRILTPGAFETAATGSIAIGSESSSLSATTRAAVAPTILTPIADVSFNKGATVNIDVSANFSGADSYALSGLPTGSGLAFSGTLLSGTVNAADVSASPITLTLTATNGDGSTSDVFVVTATAVPPTVVTPIPDLSTGQSTTVNLDLATYFSNATSYSISGLATGTGLSLSGSVLSGSPTIEDVQASPATLTVTATNSDGSVQDVFAFTATDDIAPVLSINPLTTINTTPTVSGIAGDATSLTLVVNAAAYNPVPTGGFWSQSLPALPLGTYLMTLDGSDAAGNAAVQAQAYLSIVAESANAGGRRIGFLRAHKRPTKGSIRESIRS